MHADPKEALLESGFRHLYELDFQTARKDFTEYQKAAPNDPMGKSAESASYLYEQFDAKGVLSSEFFLNDDTFLGGVNGKPSQNENPLFLKTNQQAREMAKQQLKSNPHDTRALLAITIADGMESDYDAIIQKKQFPALGMMRQAESEAATLLAADPNAKDADVALGMSNYIIGSMPAYKKAFLWFGGVHGDKQHGMELMQIAANDGHYLRPFAKVLLALASSANIRTIAPVCCSRNSLWNFPRILVSPASLLFLTSNKSAANADRAFLPLHSHAIIES